MDSPLTKEEFLEELKTDPNFDTDKELDSDETKLHLLKRVSEYASYHDYMFRICIVGDANVGKTSLLIRYCDNIFKEDYINTIGVDFRVVSLNYKDNIYSKIHIWDTAGQERFKSIALNYFRSAHGFMFVYDISNKDSFYNLKNWIELAYLNNKNTYINFLIGNKSDTKDRKVTVEDGKQLAISRGFHFLETSAKSNLNVNKAFEFFAIHLIEYFEQNKGLYESVKFDGKISIDNKKEINTNNLKNSKCFC